MVGSELRPSLDHYIGQPVKAISKWGKEDWQWAVVMEGGSLFKNHDKRRTAAPNSELVGQTMGTTIFNELDTRVIFTGESGGGEVVFTPTQYSIAERGNKNEFFPHVVDEEEQIPPIPFTPELEQRMQPERMKEPKKGTTKKQAKSK